MAITIPIISEFSDKGIASAQAGFNNLKSKINEANGAMGKMKAGFGAATDYVKANAAMMASAAGAAIAGFAIKAVGEFQDLALAAGKFSDATGVAVEDASRWIEVGGDIGIEAGAIETAINKMNIEIGKGGGALHDLGVEVVKTKDGFTDVNETFVTAIDALGRIKDPAEKAQIGTELFGKNWRSMSELITMGAADVRAAMKSVSDQKIINEDELQKAKDLRAAQDELGDAIDDLTLTIGSALIPIFGELTAAAAPVLDVVTDITEQFGAARDNAKELPSSLESAGTQMGFFTGVVAWAADGLGIYDRKQDDAGDGANQLSDRMRALVDEVKLMTGATENLTVGADGLIDAWDELLGRIDQDKAWSDLIKRFDDVKAAAWEALADKTPEAAQRTRDELAKLVPAVQKYVSELGTIPAEKQTQIVAALASGNIQQIEDALNYLARTRTVGFMPTVIPGTGGINEIGSGGRPIGTAPTLRTGSLARMSLITTPAAAGNVIVNVAGSVTTETDLVESIRKGLVNAQRNGAGLVYSNS